MANPQGKLTAVQETGMTADRQIPETWLTHLRHEGAHLHETGRPEFESEPGNGSVLAPLTHLAVIRVEGEDAAGFLDGQLSAPIQSLPSDRSVLTAWHDPKGRVLSTFLLLPDDTGYTCLMPGDLVETILPKLKMYVLRSQVDIRHMSEQVVIGLAGDTSSRLPGLALEGAPAFHYWAGAVEDALHAWQTGREAGLVPVGPNAWRRREILQGIPSLNADTTGLFLPQFLGLEHLGGLSFKKGCYTGQEVIARTHYLGKVKQGMQAAYCDEQPAASATVRDSQGKKVGQVLDAVPEGSGRWLLQIVTRETEDSLHLDDANASPLNPAG